MQATAIQMCANVNTTIVNKGKLASLTELFEKIVNLLCSSIYKFIFSANNARHVNCINKTKKQNKKDLVAISRGNGTESVWV